MTNPTLREKIYIALTDYGDFFLTNYPSQAEIKSIHPTADHILQANRGNRKG